MSRAACLHDHATDCAIIEEALELGTREPVLLEDFARAIGQGYLEDVLCQFNRSGSSIHHGLPPFDCRHPYHMNTEHWLDDAEIKRRESIPSLERTAYGGLRPPTAAAHVKRSAPVDIVGVYCDNAIYGCHSPRAREGNPR